LLFGHDQSMMSDYLCDVQTSIFYWSFSVVFQLRIQSWGQKIQRENCQWIWCIFFTYLF